MSKEDGGAAKPRWPLPVVVVVVVDGNGIRWVSVFRTEVHFEALDRCSRMRSGSAAVSALQVDRDDVIFGAEGERQAAGRGHLRPGSAVQVRQESAPSTWPAVHVCQTVKKIKQTLMLPLESIKHGFVLKFMAAIICYELIPKIRSLPLQRVTCCSAIFRPLLRSEYSLMVQFTWSWILTDPRFQGIPGFSLSIYRKNLDECMRPLWKI